MYSKAEQTKKNGTLKQRPYKNKKYLSWLHSQGLGCMVCGSNIIELHHIDSGNRGRADNKVVPLCVHHHRGRFSPHGPDAKEFFEKYSKELLEATAEILFQRFEAL